jgi:hypothetical protein
VPKTLGLTTGPGLVVAFTPVALLASSTSAAGTTPPLVSKTAPTTLPSADCPRANDAPSDMPKRTAAKTDWGSFRVCLRIALRYGGSSWIVLKKMYNFPQGRPWLYIPLARIGLM